MAKIVVETSARHIHLTQEHVDILFGTGHQLTKKKDLSQPGQYVSEERVTVVGPRRELANVSILGPVRKASQVELAFTDARSIGIVAPVRESGDIAGSAPCKLVGPAGELEIAEGVIIAKRHIHITPEDAQSFGVTDKEIVKVKVAAGDRSLVFDDVVVRVSASFATVMHIDTDESNACGGANIGEIVK
ncbi:MAG: phosphate propanoyltransferase [Oscillospiraceae bacterium]